jgi:peroxiredoxin
MWPRSPRSPPPSPRAEPAGEPSRVGVGTLLAQLSFVIVAALFVYGFVSVTKEGEARRVCSAPCFLTPDYLAADRRAPDFALKDMTGATVTLESFRDKVVLLNFWAKTCGPCLEEMPELAELTKILHKKMPDVAVVTITVDEGPADVLPTLQTVLREPPPFQVLFDPDSEVIGGKYGTHLFPETWLIDKRGVIRARFDGSKDWTNPLVLDFIDSLARGDFCDVKIDGKSKSGICESMTGS